MGTGQPLRGGLITRDPFDHGGWREELHILNVDLPSLPPQHLLGFIQLHASQRHDLPPKSAFAKEMQQWAPALEIHCYSTSLVTQKQWA